MADGNPTLKQLKIRLNRLLHKAVPFSETIYRSTTPKYANETDLITGNGSKLYGGRWNPIGIAAVYAALTPETAMAETLAHYRYYGIPIEDAMPRTFVAINVNLRAVLDFRLGSVRRRLQVSLDRILNVDWRKEVYDGDHPITQAIGLAALEVGLEGLIVPSAADPKGNNILVFPKNLHPLSDICVLHGERLET